MSHAPSDAGGDAEELELELIDDIDEDDESGGRGRDEEEREERSPYSRSTTISSSCSSSCSEADGDGDESENDELHIAARAGIRLLEENMHFREEVGRLRDQITHLTSEKNELTRTLDDRDRQIAALALHRRESMRESQSVASELSHAKEKLVHTQEQIVSLQDQLVQQRSPHKRPSQRQSPRRSSTVVSNRNTFALETVIQGEDPATAMSVQSPHSPTAPVATNGSTSRPVSPLRSPHATDRWLNGGDSMVVMGSPRRRPSLAKVRELEAKYEDEHQKCSSLRLELNFAQRRIAELKPLQSQLVDVVHELNECQSRVNQQETQLLQWQAERAEEHELIQSLRHTITVYEQLTDPRQRAQSSGIHCHGLGDPSSPLAGALQEGGAKTTEMAEWETTSGGSSTRRARREHDHVLRKRALEEENEGLLQQLTALADQVLSLTANPKDELTATSEDRTTPSSSSTRQKYLEQQVAVLQDLLRRFRLEWQLAHDANGCLELENHRLHKQVGQLQEEEETSRRRESTTSTKQEEVVRQGDDRKVPQQEDDCSCVDAKGKGEEEYTDNETTAAAAAAAQERRQWERTTALCDALLASSPEDDTENELLCFALVRRLVDSWTTDKPKRMKLHDWLTNALRHTGVRKPLVVTDLSSEIAMGFQTLLVPILKAKFGIDVHVGKTLHSVVVTDLEMQVLDAGRTPPPLTPVQVGRLHRVHHSLLAAIDGESACSAGGGAAAGRGRGGSGDDYYQEYSVRRASRGFLGK